MIANTFCTFLPPSAPKLGSYPFGVAAPLSPLFFSKSVESHLLSFALALKRVGLTFLRFRGSSHFGWSWMSGTTKKVTGPHPFPATHRRCDPVPMVPLLWGLVSACIKWGVVTHW